MLVGVKPSQPSLMFMNEDEAVESHITLVPGLSHRPRPGCQRRALLRHRLRQRGQAVPGDHPVKHFSGLLIIIPGTWSSEKLSKHSENEWSEENLSDRWDRNQSKNVAKVKLANSLEQSQMAWDKSLAPWFADQSVVISQHASTNKIQPNQMFVGKARSLLHKKYD